MNRTVITKRDLKNISLDEVDLTQLLSPDSLKSLQNVGLIDNVAVPIDAEKLEELQKATPTKEDNYTSRLLKYIPTEVIALFLFIHPLIPSDGDSQLYNWLLFSFGTFITPIYLNRLQKVNKIKQLVISTFAFTVWVFAIGGPFSELNWYKNHQFLVAVLPAVFTFVIPIIEVEN